MRNPTLCSAVTALVVLGAGPAALAEPPKTPPPAPAVGGREVDLRPKFRVGRDSTYLFELSSANKLKSTATPEIDGDQTLTQSIGLKLHTVEVGDDGATVEFVYERIKATLETKEFKATFDSTAPKSAAPVAPAKSTTPPAKPTRTPKSTPPPPPGATPKPSATKSAEDRDMDELLAQIMQPMVGTKLVMKIDKNGNIKSVSGGEALAGGGAGGLGALSGLLGGAGGAGGTGLPGVNLPAGAGAASAAGPAGWIISGPGQKSIVHVGETWTNNDSLGGTPIGGLNMVTKHTCKSANESAANLSFAGRADAKSLGGGPESGLPGGFQLKESSYGGTYTWDLVRGELKDMSSTLSTVIEQGSGKEGSTRLSGETRMSVKRTN